MRSLALAIAFILCGVAGVNAAERVPVRDGLHADYGRIVFDWPSEVGYEAGIEAGRLVVTFAEPGDFEGSLMRAGLPGYATAPQVSEDGRRLSLRLDGAVALKHFRIGSKVVIDLQRAAPATVEPDAAAAPGTADAGAAEAARVPVRAGQHGGFSRLVFDWAGPVGNVIEQSPGRARIVFDRPAAFDTSAVRPARLAQIAEISADRDGVTIGTAEGSRLEVTRSGTKVVLDIYGAGTAAAALPKTEAPKIEAPKTEAPKTAGAAVADLSPRTEASERVKSVPAKPDAAAAPAAKSKPAPTSLVPESMARAALAGAAV